MLLKANQTFPDFFKAVTYIIGERSPSLANEQRKKLEVYGKQAEVRTKMKKFKKNIELAK